MSENRTSLTDDSPMPFGKHRGEKMSEVPASYLLWLWDNGIYQEKGKPVHNYIAENFKALEMDAPDYIVGHAP